MTLASVRKRLAVWVLRRLTPGERVEVAEVFCGSCGIPHPPGTVSVGTCIHGREEWFDQIYGRAPRRRGGRK